MTAAARLLRFDRSTWERYQTGTSLAWAVIVAVGAYFILAFDRFGIQGAFEPRATVRMLLIGFYGWLWLAGASWLVGRLAFGARAPLGTVFRLYGYAHLPLMLSAITIQVVSVAFQILGPALVISLFAGLFWMPALLVAATRQAFDLDSARAIMVVIGPYAVWLLVVGRLLFTHLGHLL